MHHRPMGDGGAGADSDPVRREVLARIADPAGTGSPLTVPTARLGRSTPPTGSGERALARVGIPAAALSGIALCGLVVVLVAILVGWTGAVPTVLALLLAVGTAAGAGVAVQAGILGSRRGRLRGDGAPLRWESGRQWIGPLGTGSQRRLVDVACRAAEQIAACPAWWAPELDDHRLTLDLAAELDQIDGQAHALAERAGTAGPDPADPEWAALLDHVTALVGYADRLQRYAVGAPAAAIAAADPRRQLDDGATAAGAARDEFATEHLRRLSGDLTARTDPPAG